MGMSLGDPSLGGLTPGPIPLVFRWGAFTPLLLYVLFICPSVTNCLSLSPFYSFSLDCFPLTGTASGSTPRAASTPEMEFLSTNGPPDGVT